MNHYSLIEAPHLSIETRAQIQLVQDLNQQLEGLKKEIQDYQIWTLILQKLRASWTYHSNAIEGSTLSLGDTIFFLQEGLTVEGKPFKDFLDAQNHAEAIEYFFSVVRDERNLTTGLMREINQLLLNGVKSTPAMTTTGERVNKPLKAGAYKTLPNHVLKKDGTLHRYVEPEQVPVQMEALFDFLKAEKERLDTITLSALAHYHFVRIHPFDDGNGRGARILMNLILMRGGFFPAIIRRENKNTYLKALEEADKGNIEPFILFIVQQLAQTLNEVIADLKLMMT